MDVEIGNWFKPDDGERFWWKLCMTPLCQNFICRGYSDDHCYLHLSPEQRARKDADTD